MYLENSPVQSENNSVIENESPKGSIALTLKLNAQLKKKLNLEGSDSAEKLEKKGGNSSYIFPF